MNRRDLVKLGVAQAAMVAVPGGVVVQTAAQATSKNAESVTVSNAQLQLTVTPSENLQCRLLHVPTGRVLAEDAILILSEPCFLPSAERGKLFVASRQHP